MSVGLYWLMLRVLTTCFLGLAVIHASAQTAYKNTPQVIPGRVEFEFYDPDGELLSYHDTDSINNGSGKLNPPDGSYLNEFRMKEAVDISYTKTKGIDDSPYNKVQPEMNQLYVGWTAPEEWMMYTVDVKKNGSYRLSLMYTANGDGVIQIEIGDNNIKAVVPSTYDSADTIAWRQWHHWNKLENLGTMNLKKGKNRILFRTLEHGNMNFDFLEFKLAD